MKVTTLVKPIEAPQASALLDLVRNVRLLTNSSGEPPVKYKDYDYVSHSYLSMLDRCLRGEHQFFGNEKYLKFGHELHKRFLKPKDKKVKLLNEEELLLARMIKMLRKDKLLMDFLGKSGTKVEIVTVKPVWDPICGYAKVILDMRNGRKGKDLKSTSATTDKEFFNACLRYGYFKQAALYMEAEGLDEFEFVAPSKKVDRIFRLQVKDHQDLLAGGIQKERGLIQIHRGCQKLLAA